MKVSRFVKDSGTLISSNVWAQVVALISYLVLTRIYDAKDVGLFNVFYSYIEVLIIISTCKYEMGIVLADDNREASAISKLALRLNALVSIAVMLAIFAISSYKDGIHHLNYTLIVMIPLMVYFCGTSRVYSGLFNRYKRYSEIASSEVVNSTSSALLKILLAFPRFLHNIGLILGTVLGKALSNLCYVIRLTRLNIPTNITKQERRLVAKKYRNFPLYTAPKDLINSFSYNLPFLWLALYFDKAEIGLFSLALTFTFRPINVFNNAFEKILYARISEKVHNHRPIWQDIRKFVLYVGGFSLPIFLVGYLFAEPLFTFFFSGKWAGCGYYVRCLLPWVYVMLLSSSLMFISSVFSRQRTEFGFYIGLLALRVISMLVGIFSNNFKIAILLFGISGTVACLSLLAWYIFLVKRYEKQLQ